MAEEDVNWTVDLEVSLFHAMRGHKPIGVNRHFQMMCIHDRLRDSTNKKISIKQIWQHLGRLYDIQALHESEIIPFPNKEGQFELPETDYGSLKSNKSNKESTKTVKEAVISSSDERVNTPTAVATPDSPKRKRTRQTIQSPATGSSDTPTSSKRARRT